MRGKQRRSDRIRLLKRLLYDQQSSKSATSSFLVFSLFHFQNDFLQKFYENSYFTIL